MSNSVPPLPRDLEDLIQTERTGTDGEIPNSARDRLMGKLGLPSPNAKPIHVEPMFSPREAPTLRRPRVPKIRSLTEIITVGTIAFVLGAAGGGATVTLFQSRMLQQSSELGVERAMLDAGRAALSRADAAGVLASVRLHEREFPQGQLIEEREALRIRALLLRNRTNEARVLLERFDKRHPNSLFTFGVRAELANAGQVSGPGR